MAQKRNNNKSQQTAKSGCTIHKRYNQNQKDLFIHGWKIADGVAWKMKILQTEDQFRDGISISQEGNGKEWVKVLMTCTAPLHATVFVYGLMNLADHTCYFKDWNWIAKPTSPNGGYLGKHISKNYNN